MDAQSRENAITLLGDGDWLKDFGVVDSTLFHDVLHLKKSDVDKLVKRLDGTVKHVICVQISDIRDVERIHNYFRCLVVLHSSCIQQIRVARLIEKLWQPWIAEHRDFITSEFQQQVMGVIRSTSVDSTAVSSLAILMDKSKIVRDLLQHDLSPLLRWVTEMIRRFMAQSSDQLNKCQLHTFSQIIKIGLQVFQQYSPQLACVWDKLKHSRETTDPDCLVEAVWAAVRSIILILTSKKYGTDCTLLSGTALTLFINSCPEIQISIDLFYSIYNFIANSDTSADRDNFVYRPDTTEQVFNFDKNLENIGCLSLINGLVTCGSMKLLCHCGGNGVLLHFQFFHEICSFCEGPVILHYQAFQLLLMWYKKLLKLINQQKKEDASKILFPIFEQTLQLIWLNWASPVVDVAEIVTEVFKLMMETATAVSMGSELADKVLSRLKTTLWFVKGKYRILSVLVQYTDLEQMVNDMPDLQENLLQCLSSNCLAPVAADVYKSFVLEIKKKKNEEGRKQVWKSMWLSTVLAGLMSTDVLMRSNTSNYWLCYSVKYLPQTVGLLQDSLEVMLHDGGQMTDRDRALFAWLSLSRVIRNTSADFHMNSAYVTEALYSDDEDIRSNAFSLICNSLRKAEPLSKQEIKLLMEFLPFSMKVDSAPFRQQLTRDIYSLLVRARDSCLAALKDNNKELLDSMVDFIEWLHNLLISNLLPGACYQRRKTSLEHLHVLYDTLVYKSGNCCRKSSTPETSQRLMEYGKSRGLLEFFSASSSFSLIQCVMDGADLIQESASMLLMKYHSWPLLSGVPSRTMACHLLSESLRLCNSPKTHESRSGVLLCQLIFQKYMVELEWNFSVEFSIEKLQFCVSLTDSASTKSSINFIMLVLHQIEQALENTKCNLSEVSKSQPMHGFVCALTKCVTGLTCPTEGLREMLRKFVTVNVNIVLTMLSVMGTGTEVCPSFADIGVALASLIDGNMSDDAETIPLSTDFQYLLSWCWKNIKGSCMSFAEVTSYCLKSSSADSDILEVEIIRRISETFFTVFTQCRHRGVIEGCRTAFLIFCTSLFEAQDPKLNIIPKQILDQVLSSIQQQDRISTSSITRKSAGLPVIIQCILVSEMKHQKHTLLESTLDTLFEISVKTAKPVEDDKQDMPQVHGLNILKALFSESILSPAVICNISSTMILVIDNFGSPYWALRNAATRLFSTLVTKIFGQKGNTEKSRNTVTLQEFQSYYPELPPLMLKILDEALESDLCAIDKLHPSLFPVLTLLANLGIQEADDQYARLMAEFYTRLEKLLGSPVYNLRHLVATACVAMVPIQKMPVVTSELVDKLVSREQKMSSNMIHGLLIFLEELLQNQAVCMTRASDLFTRLTQMQFIMAVGVCYIVKAKYIDIITGLWKKCRDSVFVPQVILETLQDQSLEITLNVGYAMYYERVLELKLEMEHDNNILLKNIQDSLISTHLEHRKSCLLFIEKLLSSNEKNSDFWKEVQCELCKLVLTEKYQPLLERCLNLITAIHLRHKSHENTASFLQQWVNATGETTPHSSEIQNLTLPTTGILIQHCEINDDMKMIENWAHRVNMSSQPGQNENRRTAAAQALIIAGQFTFNLAAHSRLKQLEQAVSKILDATLNLIQDDDIAIRKLAAMFVSSILTTEYTDVHSNLCLKMLFEYISTFWWSEACVQFLLHNLYIPGTIQTDICDATDKSQLILFDQEDNSFYAEKIYNCSMIHQAILECLEHSLSSNMYEYLSLFTSLLGPLSKDLECLFLNIGIHCKDKPVINLTTDSKVLASISCLYLLSDIVLHVCKKINYHEKVECAHLQDQISAMKKETVLSRLMTVLQQASFS